MWELCSLQVYGHHVKSVFFERKYECCEIWNAWIKEVVFYMIMLSSTIVL